MYLGPEPFRLDFDLSNFALFSRYFRFSGVFSSMLDGRSIRASVERAAIKSPFKGERAGEL